MKETLASYAEQGFVVQKVAEENPYRAGSNKAARFDAYKNGKSIEATLADERVSRAGFRWDINTGVIKLVKPTAKKAAKKS